MSNINKHIHEWYKVEVPYISSITQGWKRYDWTIINTEHEFRCERGSILPRPKMIYYFEDKDDAVRFKMVWG